MSGPHRTLETDELTGCLLGIPLAWKKQLETELQDVLEMMDDEILSPEVPFDETDRACVRSSLLCKIKDGDWTQTDYGFCLLLHLTEREYKRLDPEIGSGYMSADGDTDVVGCNSLKRVFNNIDL